MGLFKSKAQEEWKVNYIREYNEMRDSYEDKLLKKQKEIELLKSNIERRNKLLSNTSYVNKAPEKLVNEERTKLELEKNKLEELLKKCK